MAIGRIDILDLRNVKGQPGADASAFYIETSQPEILIFKQEKEVEGRVEYSPVFSPNLLTGVIYEKKLDSPEGLKRIELEESDSDSFALSLYDSLSGSFAVIEKKPQIIDGKFKINIQEILSGLENETVLKIVLQKKIDGKNVNISTYLTARYGISSDMASLSVNAGGIVGAIQNTKLTFSAEGLSVKNGGIKVLNNNNIPVLLADTEGNLTLKGYIDAWGGTFGGELKAASGSFSGILNSAQINSATGEIGGFTIENGQLRSVMRDSKNNPLIILNGAEGKIIANNIELGVGATIKDYIQLGDTVQLKKPATSTGNYLEVRDTSGVLISSFSANGIIRLGSDNSQIVLNGPEGFMESVNFSPTANTGWRISNQESIFNNVTVRGTIKSSVFSYGTTQAVGSTMIVRPTGKIEEVDIYQEEGGDIYHLIVTDCSLGFQEGDWCRIEADSPVWVKILKVDSAKIGYVAENIDSSLVGSPIINFGQMNGNSVGIGINGSEDNSFIPKQAISVFEFDEQNLRPYPRIILGKIPNESQYGFIKNSYGLYAENVMLHGMLTTKNSGINPLSSGITSVFSNDAPTTDQYADKLNRNTGRILIWAGAVGENGQVNKTHIENAPFLVDEFGNLIANSGYFKGTIITDSIIEATEIKTATLTGSKTSGHALTIRDCTEGIVFKGREKDVFELKTTALVANIDGTISLNGFRVDENSVAEAAGLYVSTNSVDGLRLDSQSIDFLTLTPNDRENSVKKAQIKYDNGIIAMINEQEHFKVTEKEVGISGSLYIGESVSYNEIIEYKPAYKNGEIVGYDLYVR